jgi:hypothetical protein
MLAVDFLEFLRRGFVVVLIVEEVKALIVEPVWRIIRKRQVLFAEPGTG